MGIATGTFQLLLQEHRLRPFSGSLLTLGKQDIFLTSADVEYWTDYHDVARTVPEFVIPPVKAEFFERGCLSDKTLFGTLGVDVESLDASDYEGCDHVADLNDPEPPEGLRGRYDLVLDTGTFEHVFHLPNAFRFCHALLREGGRVIHMSPTSNYADHGFYMLSPTLFYDFYNANGWRIRQIKVIRHTKAHDTEPYWSTDYSPEHFACLSYGGLGDGLYQTFVVAEKLPGATATRVPQQRAYRTHAWARSPPIPRVRGGVTDEHIRERVENDLLKFKNWIHAVATCGPVAIYGAGGHTRILLRVWRELCLPEPAFALQSSAPAAGAFEGLDLLCVDEPGAEVPALVVVSSHRHEIEMARACAQKFPKAAVLRFWS
ncbi:MAG TPA: class I SAM-dependent methyltransferase [Opitutaceae bacterium]